MHQKSSTRVPILMVKETTAPTPITFGITLLLNGRVELNDSSPTDDTFPGSPFSGYHLWLGRWVERMSASICRHFIVFSDILESNLT